MAEDLSHWQVPALVQPAKRLPPLPQALEFRKPTPEEKVFDYAPGTTFKIPVTVGLPLDVSFEPGEERRTLAGGDPEPVEQGQEEKRWGIREGRSGKDATMQEHLIVLPRELGMKMGMIRTTTRRTYSLVFESVKNSPIRFVRFRYSDLVLDVAPEKAPSLLPDPDEPRRYHVGYTLTTSSPTPAWTPRYVVDDGAKMYVVYPEVTLFQTVPLVRSVGAQGPQVINSRQFLNVVIVDQLAAKLELRLGVTKEDKPLEQVTITQGALRTIECPGDPACPVWPAAARQLGGQ
jgi:type IV secretion system protein VirB9